MIAKVRNVVLLAFVFVTAYAVTARALWPDPEADIGVINVLIGGLKAWRIQPSASGGHLDIFENTNLGAVVGRFNATDGSLLLRVRTSTQLSTLAPSAANELLVNSSVPCLCISTGTGAGAWATLKGSTVAVASLGQTTLYQCY